MELANVTLALSGDRGNTVPKYNVTPAEIAVLCHIHGGDAVFDIEPTGKSVERSFREEVLRLVELYPGPQHDRAQKVHAVYPGSNPVLHTEIADLGLPEELFLALKRAEPVKAKPKIAPPKAKPAPIAAEVTGDVGSLFDEDADVMK